MWAPPVGQSRLGHSNPATTGNYMAALTSNENPTPTRSPSCSGCSYSPSSPSSPYA